MILSAIIAGIVPMIIYPLFVYWMDRYEKEPLPLLGAAFLWGFLPAALLSLIAQLFVDIPLLALSGSDVLAEFVGSSFIAPITEEGFKGLAVLGIYLIWRHEFDGVFDGIIYGSLVGFGFAAIENILYFGFNSASTGDLLALIFLRAFLFGLNHALYTSLTGIGLGVARHARARLVQFGAPLAGLLGAVLVHSLHNSITGLSSEYPALLCLAVLFDWGGVVIVLITMILAVRREREWLQIQLKEEIAFGTLSEKQYALVTSLSLRRVTRLRALISGRPRAWRQYGKYFETLTELAYKKHARARHGDKGATQAWIDTLRERATALSAHIPA